MKRKLKAGSTSQSVPIFVQDTSSTTGAGLGSLVYNTASLAAKYRRQGQSSWTTITLATMTLGTWASGGFVTDGGPVTGTYELGLPDAVLASSAGVTWAEVVVYGAANMLPVLIEIELDAVDYQDTVRFGLTALPNVASGSAGAIITAGTGTAQLSVSGGVAQSDSAKINGVSTSNVTTVSAYIGSTGAAVNGTNANTLSSHDPGATLGTSTLTQAQVTGGAYALNSASFAFNAALDFTTTQKAATLARVTLVDTTTVTTTATNVTTVNDKTGYSLSAAGVQAIWDALSSALTTVGSIGKRIVDYLTGDAYGVVNSGTHGNAAIKSVADSIKAKTDNLPAAPAATGDIAAAIVTYGLDHLVYTSVIGTDIADNSIIAKLASKSATADWDTYNNTTDSHEALRDRGDAAWITATGFSTLDAAGVRSAIGMASANFDTQIGTLATASALSSVSSALTTAAANVATILGKFTGITLLAQWLGAMAGKQTPNSTALAEINATGAGSGDYSAITDSQQALRDNYTTGGDTLVVAPVVATVIGNNIVSSGTTQAFRYRPLPTGPITVVNSAGTAINLSAAAVTLRCVNTTDPTDTWTLTETTGLSVGGASNNEVSIDYVPTFYGKYKWWLDYQPSGETDWTLGGFGFFDIGDAPDPR